MPQRSRQHQALAERFRAALEAAAGCAVGRIGRLVLAVSGGADSMALLELMGEVRGVEGDVVAYVDHGLRPDTPAEAELVRAAAVKRGAEFRRLALAVDRSDEATLRKARYHALLALADETGADYVVTGHTRDDQIETIMHRLVRGAGRRGLSGMSARHGRLLRPLLELHRETLRAFLRERSIVWCEDPSNREARYVRNRLRNTVIPTLERELGAGCLDHLPEMAASWAEEEAYLESEAGRYGAFAERGSANDRRLDARALLDAPRALHRRIARRWLAARSGREIQSFSRNELDALLALARDTRGTRSLDLAVGTVLSSYGELRLVAERRDRSRVTEFVYRLSTSAPATEIVGPGGWTIRASLTTETAVEMPTDPAHEVLDLLTERLAYDLVVRSVRPGDRVRASERGTRKVQDLMVDARIPALCRATWPLIESAGRIVWVPGLARDKDFVATEVGAERVRLRWRHLDVA